MGVEPYSIDPDDPRAPPQEVWDRLSPEERAQVLARLPSEFPVSEAHPPEGGFHFEAKVRASDALGSFFSRLGRKVFLGCELPVYYPGEPMFAPDVMAVLDAEPHPRMHWAVSHEGKGLDLALEVYVAGNWRKDVERNVERYARLGIREYFVFDRAKLRLMGWRLAEGGRRTYRPILPQQGFYSSEVLGLELQLEGERLRFYYGGAPLPESYEMIATLRRMVEEAEAHRTEEALVRAELEQRLAEESRLREEELRLREEETRRREEETRRREEAERRLVDALAELERLRARTPPES
ncbi:Uma2 family endonuclease [Archangium sp.]|uniref:Uma2 family endonuclease n=1 Tax=Archangium sp. TaxID=1872627 RepID=UPI002D222D33|nr:Uma2 family endonuclease [Archangium sp.]HYO55852.1 Uma2 family endonuclease [Archangium sp.]